MRLEYQEPSLEVDLNRVALKRLKLLLGDRIPGQIRNEVLGRKGVSIPKPEVGVTANRPGRQDVIQLWISLTFPSSS
ncbi:hypothetical protein [Sphingomonas sp. UYP23]